VVVARRRLEPGHRLGVSVSKEHGRAVRRNKIKRLLREAFRLARPRLPGQYDVILIPQKSTAKLRLSDLQIELEHLLQRVQAGKGRPRKP
jgi:ribonuclease P protein component